MFEMSSNESKRVFFSIITINKNNLFGLKNTHLSLKKQSFKNYEHIIIDSNSDDGSKEYILENSLDFTKYRIENDKSIYDGMNKGIHLAEGNYILFLNSGDIFYEEKSLKNLFNEIKKDKIEKDLYYTNVYLENKGFLSKKKYQSKLTPFYLSNEIINHQSQLIKTKILKKNLFNLNYKLAGDYELFLRLIFQKKKSYKHIPIEITIYNLNGLTSENEGIKKYLTEHSEIRKFFFPEEIERIESLIFFQNSVEKINPSKSEFYIHLIFEKLKIFFIKFPFWDKLFFKFLKLLLTLKK